MSKKKGVPVPGGNAASGKGGQKPPQEQDDPEALGLMTEIEDELRAEEYKKLWDRYGNAIMVVAAVIVISVAGWQFWRQQQQDARAELARSYEQAIQLTAEGKSEDAITAFAAIAGHTGEGYAVLAQLQKAALLAAQGNDLPGALAAYRSLIDNAAIDPLFRDLATVLYVMRAIDSEDPASLEAMLNPLLNPANAFYHSVVELTAVLADKQGESTRALQLIEQVRTDPSTPPSINQRAEELAAVFKTGVAGKGPAAPPPDAATPPPAAADIPQ